MQLSTQILYALVLLTHLLIQLSSLNLEMIDFPELCLYQLALLFNNCCLLLYLLLRGTEIRLHL